MTNNNSELVSNRRAGYNYEILDTLEAGIALLGTEIKSLRIGGGNLQDAWIRVESGEALLVGCHISHYRFGNIHNHEEKRERKLLLHKREIIRLQTAQQEKGLTVIPLSLYLKKGRVKVKVGIAKGKKTFDKREAIQERDEKRHISKIMKQNLS